jgi:hypothetical protein
MIGGDHLSPKESGSGWMLNRISSPISPPFFYAQLRKRQSQIFVQRREIASACSRCMLSALPETAY